MALNWILLKCHKIISFFARIMFVANATAKRNVVQYNEGFVREEIFRGGNLFEGKGQEERVEVLPGWKISWRKKSGQKLLDPRAGLQVCSCSGYDL